MQESAASPVSGREARSFGNAPGHRSPPPPPDRRADHGHPDTRATAVGTPGSERSTAGVSTRGGSPSPRRWSRSGVTRATDRGVPGLLDHPPFQPGLGGRVRLSGHPYPRKTRNEDDQSIILFTLILSGGYGFAPVAYRRRVLQPKQFSAGERNYCRLFLQRSAPAPSRRVLRGTDRGRQHAAGRFYRGRSIGWGEADDPRRAGRGNTGPGGSGRGASASCVNHPTRCVSGASTLASWIT